MATILNASTSSGAVITPDTSGILQLQSNGTTVATLNATGVNAGIQVASNAAPAFSAYASTATNTATATYTKLIFDTEEFDTNNNFASSRFTPTVAGYYQINAAVNTGGYLAYSLIALYKNGTIYKTGTSNPPASGLSNLTVSSIVFLNGSTDYIEIYWYQASGVTVNTATGLSNTYFNGAMVRSA